MAEVSFTKRQNTGMGKRLYAQLYCAETGESITFPISPESVELTTERSIETYNILDYGEVPIRGTRTLKRIPISVLLPSNQDTLFTLLASLIKQLNYKPYSMEEAIAMVDRWVENGNVIRFIYGDKINKEFLIERHTQTIREYAEDEPYSLELVEYRSPTAKTVALPNNSGNSKLVQLVQRKISKYIPAQLTGQTGQTIYKIAKLTYGGRFKELLDKNGLTNANMSMAGKTIEMLPL